MCKAGERAFRDSDDQVLVRFGKFLMQPFISVATLRDSLYFMLLLMWLGLCLIGMSCSDVFLVG